jgi:hypothetical protein
MASAEPEIALRFHRDERRAASGEFRTIERTRRFGKR